MSGQIKVFCIPFASLGLILRGEAEIANLPADAQVVGACIDGKQVCLGVFSAGYPVLAFGQSPPRVVAMIERRGGGRMAA